MQNGSVLTSVSSPMGSAIFLLTVHLLQNVCSHHKRTNTVSTSSQLPCQNAETERTRRQQWQAPPDCTSVPNLLRLLWQFSHFGDVVQRSPAR